MNREKPVVAAFDFDGTISRRDTFLPFLTLAFGRVRLGLVLASLGGEAMQVALRRSDRDRFKARLIGKLFLGQPVAQLRRIGQAHARATTSLLRPAALARIEWHRARGHRLVMVSASLDLYLDGIAARLGFDDLLCTGLSVAGPLFDGGMAGPNCRGGEKVRRLEGLLGDLAGIELYAYGDSAGDRELLAAADHPFYRPF